MSIEKIIELNPNYKIYSSAALETEGFGRVLPYDATDIVEYVNKNIPFKQEKASYKLDYAELHDFDVFKKVKHDIYGELNIQCGIVSGLNEYLTGIEFHQGSEVNIAFTDCLLLLGKTSQLKGTTFDTTKAKVVYLKKGEVVEIYGSTLHYTPIQVDPEGFSLGVILLEGTNSDIEYTRGEFLTKKNKWYICHQSQTAKIEAGNIPGLLGEMIHIRNK
ncbi:MAG: DUF4867 family protein [Bacillota bacterium]|nr:DUF4867 family protein [Bacillota bacterium]